MKALQQRLLGATGCALVRVADGEQDARGIVTTPRLAGRVPKDKAGHCQKKIASNPFLGSGNLDCNGFPITPVRANDPNLKVGIQGAGAGHFITPDTRIVYTIFFENLDTATAAAQVVTVTDQLDLATLDPATFSVGTMTFGGPALIPPPGQSSASSRIDLSPSANLVVRADATLETATGVVTSTSSSLDPVTQQLTEDPLAGFLPPNVSPPEGESSVSFTIRPRAAVASGVQLRNQASIVFDANAPIDTPEWCHGIDTPPPTSRVTALAPAPTSSSFTGSWSGSDAGAGIADCTIWVSGNGGPFTPSLQETLDTSAMFDGTIGESYAFHSIARDALGNLEAAAALPDATTRVSGSATATSSPSSTPAKTITGFAQTPVPPGRVSATVTAAVPWRSTSW